MSNFFSGHVKPMETGWYEGIVKDVSEPRLSGAGNEYVNVQFDLKDQTQPVFMAATQSFYDNIVLATGGTSRNPEHLKGSAVALSIEVDSWGNKRVRKVQHMEAPRTSEDFAAARQTARPRVAVAPAPVAEMDGLS